MIPAARDGTAALDPRLKSWACGPILVINNVPVTVPNIVGDALPAAQGALGSVGLSLGTETDKGTTNCDLVGSIGSQTPAAGSVVPKGSSVAFTMWVLKAGSQCQ
jgi:beta-lactam-binding protein with PASTA domain